MHGCIASFGGDFARRALAEILHFRLKAQGAILVLFQLGRRVIWLRAGLLLGQGRLQGVDVGHRIGIRRRSPGVRIRFLGSHISAIPHTIWREVVTVQWTGGRLQQRASARAPLYSSRGVVFGSRMLRLLPLIGGGEIFLERGEEALPLGRHVFVLQFGQLPEQALLIPGDLLRDLDVHLDKQVSQSTAARVGHAVPVNPKLVARLRSGRYDKFVAALQRWYFDGGPQGGLGVGNRHAADEMLTVAFEERVRRTEMKQ